MLLGVTNHLSTFYHQDQAFYNAEDSSLAKSNQVVMLHMMATALTAKVGAVWAVLFFLFIANNETMAAYKDSLHLVHRFGSSVASVSAAGTSTSTTPQ